MLRAAMIFVCLFAANAAVAETLRGKVIKVHDGDTISVELKPATRGTPAKVENVRINAIDAPELAQPFGKEAGQYLREWALGSEARVEFDERDRYARIIGDVSLSQRVKGVTTAEIPVAERMLRRGWAWHYKAYDRQERLADLEDHARAKGVGLWQDPNPVAPWDYRRALKKAQAAKRAADPTRRPPVTLPRG